MSKVDEARALLECAGRERARAHFGRGDYTRVAELEVALLAIVEDLEAELDRTRADMMIARGERNNATRRLAEATEWRPMEDAPRDEYVLLLFPSRIGVQRGCYESNEYAKRPRPYWTCFGEPLGRQAYRDNKPLGWLPLPAAPTDTEER